MTWTTCLRGHKKSKGEPCKICKAAWLRQKYRDNPAFREHKKAEGLRRYAERKARD
jgi:hypothetical protein